MPFGIDDVFYLLMAAQAANSIANPPTNPTNEMPVSQAPQATQSPNAFALPGPTSPAMPKDIQIPDELFSQAAQAAAAATKGPPPVVPLQPSGGGGAMGPPTAANDPFAAGNVSAPPSIGEILMASPQALSAVAGLLGLGQSNPTNEVAAPIPGGARGGVVPSFNLPGGVNIGQILSQIPRYR